MRVRMQAIKLPVTRHTTEVTLSLPKDLQDLRPFHNKKPSQMLRLLHLLIPSTSYRQGSFRTLSWRAK
jgi:hypothetical protein